MSANSDYSELVNGSSEPEPSAVAATASLAADPDPQLSDPEDTNAQPPEVESVDGEASNSVPEEGILTKLSDADSRTAQSNQDVESDWKADGDRNLVSEEGILNELSDADSRTAQSNQGVESDSKPGNAEADRTFTMRELLSDLKNGDANSNDGREADTPRHSHPSSEQQIEQNNATMELMESVTGLDEDGRTRQRVLTYTAWRYASTVERNPEDYDAFYNWGLVIQESADNLSPESSHSKDALLGEACKKYEEATRLCPTLNEAYYNWAIALSDRAKMRGRTKEAEEFWKQSAKNYEKAIQLNWNSPQALNNWGLALQELSAIVPAREKQTIVRAAISKFRAAIQLQFDFHRAIYNLGTVLYSLAEDILRTGGHFNSKVTPDEFYSQSAQYIAAANALKPNYPVYTGALKIVRAMLPLPYLKFGYLTAPPVGNPVAPHSDWKRSQFVLNHEGLQQIHKAEHRYMAPSLSSKSGDSPVRKPAIRVNVADIVSVSACADLTLPPGAGLCIDTIHGPVFLVAESWESLDGWVDAIRLVYTIFARGKSDALAGIITA